jgi:formamidopyrimidine-DNA glycosylase
MPELPEVEATAQYLSERVISTRITAVRVLWERTIFTPSATEFSERVVGAEISRVFRRGKFVVLQLDKKSTSFLLIHLRMSGSLDVIASTNELHKHDRLDISLSTGRSIRFHDTRKFGRAYHYDSLDGIEQKIGIEPLSSLFTPEKLFELLKTRKSQIKPFLLNQSVIAGLGNIYVDEALWEAKIHPLTPTNTVTLKKAILLHESIQRVLGEAISKLGTDFGDNVVHGGMYTPKVYGRAGEECLRCGKEVVRIVVGQRGTHICQVCQK